MNSIYNVDAWQKANYDMAYQWDYDMGSPRTMVNQYNDVSLGTGLCDPQLTVHLATRTSSGLLLGIGWQQWLSLIRFQSLIQVIA